MNTFKVIWPKFWKKLETNTRKHIESCVLAHSSFQLALFKESHDKTATILIQMIHDFLKKKNYIHLFKFNILKKDFDSFCNDLQTYVYSLLDLLCCKITSNKPKNTRWEIAVELARPTVDAVRSFLKFS
jgi:hypothetical protein